MNYSTVILVNLSVFIRWFVASWLLLVQFYACTTGQCDLQALWNARWVAWFGKSLVIASYLFSHFSSCSPCSSLHSPATDLSLHLTNPRLLDDVSFHPCVRYKRWEVRRPSFLSLVTHFYFIQQEKFCSNYFNITC